MILVSQATQSIGDIQMHNRSISCTRWNCTYHIVFISKYRKKIMYGELRRDIIEIIKKLCEMKQVELIDISGRENIM